MRLLPDWPATYSKILKIIYKPSIDSCTGVMGRTGTRNFGGQSTAMDVVEGMNLEGRTFFITGGNSGKGFQTARALALKNAHVVLGCRNFVRGMDARGDILEEKRDANIDVLQIDNSDLQSVRDCAEKYAEKGWPLHCLILNAAVFDPIHRITDDEFETTFQVNHLAHFLLTQLFTPILLRSAPARVVVVTSDSHRHVTMIGAPSVDDITWQRLSPTHTHSLNTPLAAYNLSQLCNVLFAGELRRRLASHGVTVICANPGLLDRKSDERGGGKRKLVMRGLSLVAKPWMKSDEKAASTIVYCSVSPELLSLENSGGECSSYYFENCRPKSPSSAARKHDLAEQVWEISELMIQTHQDKLQRTFAKLLSTSSSVNNESPPLGSISEEEGHQEEAPAGGGDAPPRKESTTTS